MPSWDTTHDPDARPLGCNGMYGSSGNKRHRRNGTPPCDDCRASDQHYSRELRRGQRYPRYLHPCGTPAAARRHRQKKQPLDVACAIAEAKAHAEYRERKRQKETPQP